MIEAFEGMGARDLSRKLSFGSLLLCAGFGGSGLVKSYFWNQVGLGVSLSG